jgi:hypothetical protein
MGGKKRKSANSLDNSLMESNEAAIQKLIATVETLTSQLADVTKKLAEQAELSTSLAKELAAMRSNAQTGPQKQVMFSLQPYGAPPTSIFSKSFTSDLVSSDYETSYLAMGCDILRNAVHVSSKDTVAVIENLADNNPQSTDYSQEQTFCNDICEKAGITKPSSVWRHTPKGIKPNSRVSPRPRIVKVKFASVQERNNFIYKFRSNLTRDPSPLISGRPPSVRRDMVPMELALLYKLRKRCYEMNQAAGQRAYYVRDLTICEVTRRPS